MSRLPLSHRPSIGESNRTIIEPLEPRQLFAGSGLSGAYFDNPNVTGKVLARTDSQISFDWNAGAPVSGVGSDYAVRWTGRVQAKFTEQYRFAALSAGGVRLWVDNKLIIDNWNTHSLATNSGYVNLSAGKRYNVRMEYLNTGAAGTAKLYWESARQPKQIVPKSYLYSSDVDSTAPTQVSNLRAALVTDKTITIGWNASSDPSMVVYYDVYIGKTKVATTTDTTYTRAGRTPDTEYNFTVIAVDPSGNAAKPRSVLVKTLAAPASAGGIGLAAKYYAGTDFSKFIFTRTDNAIDFNWSSAPVTTHDDQFNVKWEGSLVPHYTENYTLYTTSDDGVRVWIDGSLVINNWTDHASTENRATLNLTANKQHAIRVQYKNSAGAGKMKLEWSSASQPRQVVPSSQLIALFTDTTAPTTPDNVRVVSVAQTAVHLAWDPSADDVGVYGYDVYRGSSKVATVNVPDFTDTGLSTNTQYEYKVVALDGFSRTSAVSKAVSARTSPAPVSRDSLDPIAATSFDSASGASKSGNNVTGFGTGDWMEYANVDFHGGGTINSVRITLAVATANVGGSVELRLDSTSGPVIGTMVVQSTGSFVTYLTQHTQISNVSGKHDLFLVGKGGGAIANVQTIQFSTQKLVKIMPLGDSITQSNSVYKTYRYYLYHQLEDQGVGVDFVGSQRLSTDNQTPADLDFDQDHEGHSGWRSDQIKANIANWASTYRPDVVLLHIGTNDIRQGVSPNVAANNVAGIIDILRSIVPNVKIVVAQIIPCGDADPNLINAFNQLIPNIASQKNNANSRVVVADQFSGFSLATDSDDNLHPNDSGDQKMADRWYQQLAPLLT